MKRALMLLILLPALLSAQWDKNADGKTVPNDSTKVVKVTYFQVDGDIIGDSLRLINTVPFVDNTSTAWLGANNVVLYYPFTLTNELTPDSVYFYTRSASATTDTMYFAIHSWDLTTKYCQSDTMTLANSSGWARTGWTTTQRLGPGTYIVSYGTPNMVSSALPSVAILSGAEEFYMNTIGSIDGLRRVGYVAGGLSNGSIQANLTSGVARTSTYIGLPSISILGH